MRGGFQEKALKTLEGVPLGAEAGDGLRQLKGSSHLALTSERGVAASMTREFGTYRTAKARFWTWLSGKSP
jgi:hypothetical protein